MFRILTFVFTAVVSFLFAAARLATIMAALLIPSVLASCVVLVSCACNQASAGTVYWANEAEALIQRADIDNPIVKDLVNTAPKAPRFIAIDVASGKMYWTTAGPIANAGTIQRADLNRDISDPVEPPLVTGLSVPNGIALDLIGGKMYWGDEGNRNIQRANLNGTNVQELVNNQDDGIIHPFGLALDVTGIFTAGVPKIYWADSNANKIQRANLDGNIVEDLVSVGLVSPGGFALDLNAGKMYWTDVTPGKIMRSNIEIPLGETAATRTDVEDLVTGLQIPLGITLDLGAGKMYWTSNTTDDIRRANLEMPLGETAASRSDVEVIVSGLAGPTGIAFIPEPSPLTLLTLGALGLLGYARQRRSHTPARVSNQPRTACE